MVYDFLETRMAIKPSSRWYQPILGYIFKEALSCISYQKSSLIGGFNSIWIYHLLPYSMLATSCIFCGKDRNSNGREDHLKVTCRGVLLLLDIVLTKE